MQDYLPDEKQYVLDDALVWEDLWVTAHVWAERWTDDLEVGWINFRLVEWDAVRLEGSVPVYPTGQRTRGPGTRSLNLRAADPFAWGFLKWDGCMEIDMDHHMCGVGNYQKVATAILRLFLWAGVTYGFENCEMEEGEESSEAAVQSEIEKRAPAITIRPQKEAPPPDLPKRLYFDGYSIMQLGDDKESDSDWFYLTGIFMNLAPGHPGVDWIRRTICAAVDAYNAARED